MLFKKRHGGGWDFRGRGLAPDQFIPFGIGWIRSPDRVEAPSLRDVYASYGHVLAIGELPRETIKIADLPNEVRLQFTGVWAGPVGFTVNGRTYYGAQDKLHEFINAPREDVEKLVASGKWKVLASPQETSLQAEAHVETLLDQLQRAGVPNSRPGIIRK